MHIIIRPATRPVLQLKVNPEPLSQYGLENAVAVASIGLVSNLGFFRSLHVERSLLIGIPCRDNEDATRFNLLFAMSTNKPQYALLHHFAIEALCLASYTVKSPLYRKAFFIAITAAVGHAIFCANLAGVSGHSPFTDQFIGMRLASLVIFASVDLLIRDAQKEYRHVGDKDDVSQRSFLQRLWWAFQINVNPRGINWTYELTSALPQKPQHKSRLSYAAFAIRDILVLSLLNEVHCLVSHLNPYFDPGVPKIEGNQWLWRLYSCGFALGLKWIITLEVRLASLVCMALGFTRPEDWPSVMGPVSEAYTVGRFWG